MSVNRNENTKTVSMNVAHRGGQILQIQVLRTLCALSVALFHIGFLDSLGPSHNVWLVNGVFIFYAISVTMLSTEKGNKNFMWKRIIRIFPLYWFVTLATFIAMRLVPSLFPYEPTWTELFKSMFLIPYSHAAHSTATAMYPIASMGHTIQTTMFYYLLFLLASKICFKHRGLLCCVFISIIVACGLIFAPKTPFLKFYTKFDLFYFVSGIAVFLVIKKIGERKLSSQCLAGVASLVLLAASMCTSNHWVITAMVFALLFTVMQLDGQQLSNNIIFRKLASMGNWTFSFFLIHLYAIRVCEVFGGSSFSAKAVVFDIIAIILAWIASYVLYVIIEQKFTNKLKGFLFQENK